MSTARVNGVTLYNEETGSGLPLLWRHEFGGDYRSLEPQARHPSRRYRVLTCPSRAAKRRRRPHSARSIQMSAR